MSKGGAVVVYTGGITDALNAQGEDFCEERLIKCCNSAPEGADAEAIGRLISKSIAEWTAGVGQFDDTTILVLSVQGAESRVTGSAILRTQFDRPELAN